MYHLLTSPDHATMTVISDTDLNFPVFCHMNYLELAKGTEKHCQAELERMDPLAQME